MKTAQLFKNGQSQAVRLPKEFRFNGTSVYIKRLGTYVVLIPKNDNPWRSMFEATRDFTSDFMVDRDQGSPSKRENFD
ncbi:MAG: type II toxin-antitoxin system VapB family antitoxin [Myxococcota bacterium]|nr:type II toxin-antitoxin system VapB family antitoxin [Myxococcota bacterium]